MEAVPTEDVVQALIESLVEPVLPLKSSKNDPNDLSLQQSVANQMHAVVLLYNYYHRKQFPQLEFLDFESFCKVAVNSKPSLLAHLNYMKNFNNDEGVKNLSATEKAIMDACNISLGLDPSKDAPSMEGWPVSKIAVFLTDSMQKNCCLLSDVRTKGVWSLIEIGDSEHSDASEGVLGAKSKEKMKRPSKWPVGVLDDDETRLRQLVISAVKETTDIDPAQLTILENHIAYSLSEEKATARLFIVKCNLVNENVFRVPIEDAINSLQGPLAEKCCNGYIAADIVEYFHLLPYGGKIRDWFYREVLANGSVLPSSKNDKPVTTVTTERSVGPSVTCHDADPPVVKKNTKTLKKKKNRDLLASRDNAIDEGKSSKFSHPSKETQTSSEVLIDNGATKISTESDLRSTKNSSTLEGNMVGPVNGARGNDTNVGAGKGGPVVVSVQVPVVSNGECLVGCSIERKRELVLSRGSKVSIHEEEDREEDLTKLKEIADIEFSSDKDPDKPLDSDDKLLLTDAILKVVNDEQTSSLIRSVHACKKWRDTEDIRVEILTRRDDLLGRSQKRQRVCPMDSSPAEGIVSVGSVSFPQQYKEMYKSIVDKFGDVISPESKVAALCGDIVSAAMKSLFELVDSMLRAPPRSVDGEVVDSWEIKLRFCEFAGLKVGWLRTHFEPIRDNSCVVRELKGRATEVGECLEGKRKRAAQLRKELEAVLAEEKALVEQKVAVDADLKAALRTQEAFSFSLFS